MTEYNKTRILYDFDLDIRIRIKCKVHLKTHTYTIKHTYMITNECKKHTLIYKHKQTYRKHVKTQTNTHAKTHTKVHTNEHELCKNTYKLTQMQVFKVIILID